MFKAWIATCATPKPGPKEGVEVFLGVFTRCLHNIDKARGTISIYVDHLPNIKYQHCAAIFLQKGGREVVGERGQSNDLFVQSNTPQQTKLNLS